MPESVSKRKKISQLFRSQKLAPYVFVLPFIISFLLFMLYPIISAVIMSFQDVAPGQIKFVGLANYRALWNDRFFTAINNTVHYTIWTLIVLIPVPLILATMLNSTKMIGRKFFRSTLFLPALTSIISAGIIFRLLFGELPGAPMNGLLSLFGLSPVKWMSEKHTAMLLMVLLASWRWIGVNLLYFLSGLQNIPNDLYEAAEIDGAGTLRKWLSITLPMLKPVSVYVLTISIYGSLSMFTESFVFWSNHSPSDIGMTIVGYLYQQTFENFRMGFGAAIGVSLMLAVLIINLIQLTLSGTFRKEE
jgi:arabinosaccharide transport system permease protein